MDKHNVTGLLSLPTEILVHVLSFLTAARDKVKLRYVSRQLQSVSETPLLWREFVWPYHRRSTRGAKGAEAPHSYFRGG